MLISSAVENLSATHAKEPLYFLRPLRGDKLHGGGAAADGYLQEC